MLSLARAGGPCTKTLLLVSYARRVHLAGSKQLLQRLLLFFYKELLASAARE